MCSTTKLALGTLAVLLATGLAAAAMAQDANEAVEKALGVVGGADVAATGEAAISCSGADDAQILTDKAINDVASGVAMQGSCEITLRETAIVATVVGASVQGSGELTIERGSIRAPIAIDVQGAAVVRLEGVEIEGEELAIRVQGSAEVYLKDCKIRGAVKTLGTAEIHDEGGNEFSD